MTENDEVKPSALSLKVRKKDVLLVLAGFLIVMALGLGFLTMWNSSPIKENHAFIDDSILSTKISLELAANSSAVSDNAVISGNTNGAVVSAGLIAGQSKFSVSAPVGAPNLNSTKYVTIVTGTVKNYKIEVTKMKNNEKIAVFDSKEGKISYE